MTIDARLVGQGHTNTIANAVTASGTSAALGSTFVILTSASSATVTGVTDSKGNTYTEIGTAQTEGASPGQVRMFKASPGDSGYVGGGVGHFATAATGGSSSFAVAYLVEITGATSSPLDQNAQGADAASPFTLTSPTLGQAVELVLSFCSANNGDGTNTYSSSNTTIVAQESDSDNYFSSVVSKLITSSTSAVTPSFTCLLSTSAALKLATFKDAGGSPPASKLLRAGNLSGLGSGGPFFQNPLE